MVWAWVRTLLDGLGSGKTQQLRPAKTSNFLSLKKTMITIMREKDDHDHRHDLAGRPSRLAEPLLNAKIQMKDICDALSEGL